VIECDHVEALGSKLVQTLIPAEGMPDLESMAREGTFDKAAQAIIVIDIKKPDRWGFDDGLTHRVSGS
jgi:hypothetical protein